MSESDALAGFSDKWRAHWPEWAIAEAFVPPHQRKACVAWFALLQELADASWGGSDAAPGLAKLAWWQDELHGWGKGARRHPLGSVLQLLDAPWNALAAALPTLRDQRDAPSTDPELAMARLAPFASAAAQVEAALFGGSPAPVEAIAAALLAEPATQIGHAGALPVLAGLLGGHAGPRARLLLQALLQARVRAALLGSPWRPVPRWSTLWRCWRAARN